MNNSTLSTLELNWIITSGTGLLFKLLILRWCISRVAWAASLPGPDGRLFLARGNALRIGSFVIVQALLLSVGVIAGMTPAPIVRDTAESFDFAVTFLLQASQWLTWGAAFDFGHQWLLMQEYTIEHRPPPPAESAESSEAA